MEKKKLTTRDLCLIGIFTSMIAVMAQITVPLPYIPMTLQTFVIPFAGIVLGARRGMLATVFYVLLGAVGMPVFAGFTGGLAMVFGPTGGFILSFPIMALTAGIAADKGNKIILAAGLIVGAVINYLCGMLFFCLIMSSDLHTAFITCVLPFIPTAIIKIILSGLLGLKCRAILERGRLLA